MARSTRGAQAQVQTVQGDVQDQQQFVHNTRRRAGSLVKSLPSRTRTKATPPPQGSPSAQSSPKQGAAESHNTRFAQSRRPAGAAATASTSQSPPPPVLPDLPTAPVETVKPAPVPAAPSLTMPDNAPPGYRPASMRPPLSRIPAFPLVDSYVPDTSSSDRRHPRQFIPDQLAFPTDEMEGKVRKEDREDKLLMATCAVLHAFENRALCPKEVAEVMLERNWLKNAGTTPFAHVSTCIRSHVSRAAAAQPPYTPLLVPFELVGALTAEEVRAVGLHAEQRPAVKRGTLWYLNPQVFGPGVGADDPFVRCRREAGLAPSDKDGLYVRGLVPLQHNPAPLPPALALSSTLFNTPQDEADAIGGDEEGMGRGKRKRRASSAMMAAMGSPATPGHGPSPLGSGSSTPVAIPAAPRVHTGALAGPPGGEGGHRRSQSFGGPSSAPVRSGIPKLKLRLTSLDEVDDSDGHTGEAAEWRRKNKKKVRRAGSDGLSRAGSVESNVIDDDDDDDDAYSTSSLSYRPSTFSSASSSALLAQSLLAASTPGSTARTPDIDTSLAPHTAVSPEILSLAHSSGTSFPFARPVTTPLHLSASVPNIFSHHFAHAPSPPDVVMDDAPSPAATDSRPTTSAGLATAVTPPSDSPTSEDDFHEAMLRGDDFDFEWGSESYTTAGTGASSVEASATIEAAVSDASEEAQAELLAKAFEQQAAVLERRKEAQAGREKERAVTPAHGEEATIDTPATTPRSHGKELQDEAEEVKVSAVAKKALGEEGIEVVKGPLGTISQIGMRVTLCGGFSGVDEDDREDGDVVIVASRSHVKPEEVSSSDPDQSTDTLINLAAHELPAHKSDSAHLIAPPPSPLPLDLSPVPAFNNAFAAVDFDFVGHEEVERSQDGFGFIHDVDLADDEDEGEEDEIVTVKVEDDEPEMAVSSAPSSRASSAVPAFHTRLFAGVRAGSTGSSSSDSDAFDPMTFVTPSTLATGLPVPQPAPSPPEMTDWSLSMDMLDDIDAEHAAPVDLMAPETIGLEELDLAWAGDDDEGSPPAPIPKPSPRIGGGLTLTVPRSSATAFLTGSSHPHSPHRFTSPIPSPRRSSSSRVPVLADFGKMSGRGAASPAPPALSRTSSSATIFAGSTQRGSSNLSGSPKLASSNVVMEPVIPLEPLVIATIIQRGVVVFLVEVTDLATARTVPLLRRLDTDYVNATVLLQAALSSPLERASALAGLLVKTDTFRVPAASDTGVEGTWIPISVARDFLTAHADQLGHLASFLSDDLAAHFPEPVPTMCSSGRTTLEQKGAKDPNIVVLGSPSFEGAELLRRCGPPGVVRRVSSTSPATPPPAALFQEDAQLDEDVEEQSDEDEREVSSSPPPPRTRRAAAATRSTRRPSVVKPAPITEQSPPRRSTRRQAAAAAAASR
ncbi:transcription regulator HTH [Rhodotorula toruloides]|uniref:Transcription regulator HTH n=1 Tax=Rhodotorula toruloides TaxID=5286 RepID=A0A511KGW5_RHOTO|nr:transcription regulator HTH [Rhodotorula toruloides]